VLLTARKILDEQLARPVSQQPTLPARWRGRLREARSIVVEIRLQSLPWHVGEGAVFLSDASPPWSPL
jgi:hypothetical protein